MKITIIYHFNFTKKSYTLFATLFSNLLNYKSCVTIWRSEKTLTHAKQQRTSKADF